MGTIGADLRQAREAAGISREQLSSRTKIRPALLEAMERDDFGHLPAGLLGRGHLRAYAQEVHLDADRIVERFRNECLNEPPPAIEAAKPSDDVPRQAFPVRTLVTSALLVTALTLLVQMLSRPPQDGEAEADAVGTAGLLPAGARGDTAPPASAPAPSSVASVAASAAQRDSLTVELNPNATVWVEARADGRRVLYSLVRAGDRPVVQARDEIRLRLGNAGAVQYSINGKPGRAFGRPGEVRDVAITRDNVGTFQE